MAYRRILIRRDTAANWTSANPTLSSGELGAESDTGKLKLGNGSTAWNSLAYLGGVTSVNGSTGIVVLNLDDVNNVTAPSPSTGDFLKWNGTAWVNDAIDLGTDTTGNYMSGVTAGTGVTVTHTPGEGSSATIAIGQAVATNSEVIFSGLKTTSAIEVLTISATAATGTINLDMANGTTYYTVASTANFTVNLRWNSTTSLDSKLAIGEMVTTSFMVTNGATAYYASAHQIAGTAITPRWQGGSAPVAGNANSVDMYSYTVVKTAANTFSLFAALTRFA